MTIDEAIERERQKAKEQRSHIGTFNEEYSKKCEMWAEEHEQLAEWLEELKMYKSLAPRELVSEKQKNDRAMEYSKGFDYGFKTGYNKAIDDFAEKLNAKCDGMIKEKWNSNVTPISWAEAYADFKDDIDDIAEQLKAGVTDAESI